MAEIYATKEAYKYSENLILQYLRDSGYTGSMEDGTGLYDVVVKPNALIYTMLRQDIDKAYAYMSLAKAEELRSVISKEDYDAAVDGILSNWFVSRSTGVPASGLARLWYSTPPEYVKFTAGDKLGEYDGVTLLVRETVAFTPGDDNVASDYSSVVNTTNNTIEYYVDVPVVAASPSELSVPSGAAIEAVSNNIYFLRATAPADFIPGTGKESSEAFIERSKEAITTRELITDRAIHTVLRNQFPEITRLYVAGHGEPEMMRDVKTFSGVSIHVGNMADIWVASQLSAAVESVPVASDGSIQLENSPVHIQRIVSDDTGLPVAYTMSVDRNMWLVPGVQPTIRVVLPENLPESASRTVSVHEITSHVPELVHNFVHSEDNRVSSYDPQVKMMVPVVMDIRLKVVSSSHSDEVTLGIKQAVISYVDGVSRSGAVWVESELVKAIHNEVPEVQAVYVPVSCRATLFDMGLGTENATLVNNEFTLPPGTSAQITTNTVQYYTNTSLVSVDYV